MARTKKATRQEAFQGSWRITETWLWDSGTLQLAFTRFDGDHLGSIGIDGHKR
jgi:hypothetical protein